jgi:adenylate cyclase
MMFSAKDELDSKVVEFTLKNQLERGQTRFQDKDGLFYFGSFRKIGVAGASVISQVSEDKAFEQVYNIQRRNIYILGIALCIAILIIYNFSITITNPLLSLVSATNKIKEGDFHPEIKPVYNDEVGLLTTSFLEMASGLEEREKVKNILGNMVDPVVVEEAMRDFDSLKRGSERQITAFFSDVASFSTISEKLTSVQLAALLNEYLGSMTLILKKHNGVLDKYIGDAIVGIFNAPVTISQPALSAARSSLEMIEKLKELREYWKKNDLYIPEAQSMDIRIGLNSGPAKVGFMGTDALASYTMMGDTVNLAARLEAAGKDYGVNILISESVKDEIESEMFTRLLDVVRVKGKNEPVKLYELISRKNQASDLTIECTSLYEKGFQLYLDQEWSKAIEILTLSEKKRGSKDKAVRNLVERCEEYMKTPPSKDWDGVFTRTHK